jgi:hypothetical protein
MDGSANLKLNVGIKQQQGRIGMPMRIVSDTHRTIVLMIVLHGVLTAAGHHARHHACSCGHGHMGDPKIILHGRKRYCILGHEQSNCP